jgi:hypothetical protein
MMSSCRTLVASLALLAVSSLVSLPANAADNPKNAHREKWHYSVAPYAWFSGVGGFFKIHDEKANLSIPFNEIRQHLNFGGALFLEAGIGPWNFVVDQAYLDFTQNSFVMEHRAKVSEGDLLIDAGAYYRLLSRTFPQHASWEILGAGRIMSIHSTIHYFEHIAPKSDTSGILVPLLGTRIKYDFSPKVHSWLSAEIGGFQIDHVSNTWSAMLGLSYTFARNIDVSVAYRALGLNYDKQSTTINTLMQGPMVGCIFTF